MTSLLYKLAGVSSAIVMMIYDSRNFAVKVILILVQDIMIDKSDLLDTLICRILSFELIVEI